jgi:hypothetical protein
MSGNPFGVVFAKQEDEEALYLHLMNLHSENGLFPVNPDKVRAAIHSWVTPDANGQRQDLVGIIRGPDRRIEASIGLTLASVWYSDCAQLLERWTFVEAPYRASSHAKNLVTFAKWYTDSLNAALSSMEDGQQIIPLSIGILTEKNLLPKIRLYQRAGLQQIGATFMYPLIKPDAEYVNQRKFGERGGKRRHKELEPAVMRN